MPVARRGFLISAVAVPLAPAVLAQAPPAASPGGKDAVAGALAQAVKAEFGAHLDAAELDAVEKELVKGLERAERLRAQARLGNAADPVARFEARPPLRRGGGR